MYYYYYYYYRGGGAAGDDAGEAEGDADEFLYLLVSLLFFIFVFVRFLFFVSLLFSFCSQYFVNV